MILLKDNKRFIYLDPKNGKLIRYKEQSDFPKNPL